MRKFLFFLTGLVVLIVVAALIGPGLIDWNGYKGEIARHVKAETGRELVIGGDLSLTVFPAPRLAAGDVRLANMEGTAAPDMVRLKSLEVRVRFIPLLQGRIEVASISLIEPVIELEVLADGRANWRFAPKAGTEPKKTRRRPDPRRRPPPPPERVAVSAAAGAVRFDDVRILGGTLIWRDGSAGTVERIEKIDAQIAARTLAGPFRAKGRLVARGVPITLETVVERLEHKGPVPLTLNFTLPEAAARGDLSATLTELEEAPLLTGKLRLEGKNFARLIAATGVSADLPPWIAQAYGLQARVTASAKRIGLDDAIVTLGDARGTGKLTAALGGRVLIKSDLKISRIDLDRWLAMQAADKPAGGTGKSPKGGAEPAASSAPGFSLPTGLDASLNTSIEAVTLYGSQIRRVRFNAALAEGELTLNQVSARLPGNADFSLFGFLSTPDGQPKFDGTVDTRADNLRDVLTWLGVDTSDVPVDRLRRFTLAGKLRLDESLVHLLDARVRLDSSRLRGGVTVALRERLSFGASVSLDHLNLDAYLPRAPVGGTGGGKGGTGEADGKSAATAATPFAVLDDFDANVQVRIGSLNVNRTAIRGIRFDGTLAQGTLTVREAAVRNLAGTGAKLSGTLTNFAAFPVFEGKFFADSRNLTGILRVAGITTPVAPKRYGRVRLRGSADGGADRFRVQTRLDIAGATAKLTGEAEGLATRPRFSATLNVSHPRLARLAPLIGLGPAPGNAGGPIVVTLSIEGRADDLKTEAWLKASGADFNLNGSVSNPLTDPAVDLAINFSHREFVSLVRMFDPAYAPATAKLGRVELAARIKGDARKLQLGDIKGRIGKQTLSGDATLALDGARPHLSATLGAGDIRIDPFLAPPEQPATPKQPPVPAGVAIAAAPQPTGAAKAAQFSTEPFDFGALGSLDADFTVAAKALHYRQFTVTRPRFEARLADRILTLAKLDGGMYGGKFALKGILDGGDEPLVTGTVKVTKANVGKALFDAADFDIARGKLDFDMQLAAHGRTPRAMIATLAGKGRIAVADGLVRGFDLSRVSARLKNLRRPADFLSLMGAAMGGGETGFSALDGNFSIDQGRLVSDDLKLVAKAGEGRATGFADLPRWRMDFTTRFYLTEHPKAPPFGMQAVGPLDAPRRILKFEKLQAFLLQRGIERGLGKLLRKAAPGLLPQPQTQPQQTQPQPAPQQAQPQQAPQQPAPDFEKMEPKDVLRGLLKGLLKR